MKSLRVLLRDSVVYGGGDFVSKLVAFATLPLLATALQPAGFGTLDLALTISTLGGVFVRWGLNSAVQRHYWDSDVTVKQRAELVTTGLYLCLGFGVAVSAIAYLVTPWLMVQGSSQAGLTIAGLLGVILLLSGTQWAQYILDVLRLHFAPWKFVAYSLLYRVVAAVLAVAAVVVWNSGADGVLLVQGLVVTLSIPIGLMLIRKDLRLRVPTAWIKPLLTFGSPLVVAEMAYWLFSSIDRWMLVSMQDMDAVGVYAIAFRFSTVVMFVSTAFGMAWSPYSMKLRADHPGLHRQIYAEMLLVVIVFMSVVAGGVALFSGEILSLVLDSDYAAAAIPLSILCFTVVLQATQQVTAIGVSLAKRTGVFAWLVWCAAALNAALNLWLIPTWGVEGAAWATLLSYAFLSSGFLYFTQRLYPIPVPWRRLFGITALSGGLLLASLLLQSERLSMGLVLIKSSIMVTFVLLAMTAVNRRLLGDMREVNLPPERRV